MIDGLDGSTVSESMLEARSIGIIVQVCPRSVVLAMPAGILLFSLALKGRYSVSGLVGTMIGGPAQPSPRGRPGSIAFQLAPASVLLKIEAFLFASELVTNKVDESSGSMAIERTGLSGGLVFIQVAPA